MFNGRLCKSGLAFQDGAGTGIGRCAEFTSIDVNGVVLTAPYECDPTDPADANTHCTYTINDVGGASAVTTSDTPC